jgi:hypothetical protein
MLESDHFTHSVLREKIVEHVFIAEVLRAMWRRGLFDMEVLHAEFDTAGYDLVMSQGNVLRHIQLKVVGAGSNASRFTVGLKLRDKPSGCVIAVVVTPDLAIVSYRWFGGQPGQPLPDIAGMKVAKHAKANASGHKADRPGHRFIPQHKFDALDSIDQVRERLFGS